MFLVVNIRRNRRLGGCRQYLKKCNIKGLCYAIYSELLDGSFVTYNVAGRGAEKAIATGISVI